MKKSILILFGLVCIGLLSILPSVGASVSFAETAAAGTLISVLNCDYPDNCTEAVYAADKTTVKTLDTRTVTAKDAAYDNFLYVLRPADWVGFNRSNFTVYVSPWTSMTSANILVEVTLMNNSVVERNISITGVGTYFILNIGEMARYSTRSKVTTHVGTTGKTFTYKVNQSRWGVVWKTGANAFTFKYAGFQMGATTKSVNISFLTKVLSFDYNGTNGKFNRHVIASSGARSSLKFVNCSMFVDDTDRDLGGATKYMVSSSDLAFFNASNTSFTTVNKNRFQLASTTKVNFCDMICNGQTLYNGNASLDNVLFTNFKDYLYNVFCRHTNDVTFNGNGNDYGIVIALGTVLNISNSRFMSSTALFGAVMPTKDNYLVNCESDVWTYGGGAWAVGGKMHRQYTFDLRVQNSTSKANLSGVTCRVYNVSGVLVKTWTTTANGCITRTILDNTWWNSSTGIYGNIVSPYTLNLTKTGYQSMEITFVLDHAVNFTLGMKGTASGGGATVVYSGGNLSVMNPNPGNGTHLTNYLKNNVSGLTCSVDVSCINFTTPPGSEWSHVVNLTWYSNSSGVWLPFYVSYVDVNGTVTVPAVNFSGVGMYWWNVSWNRNHTSFGNSSVWSFETVTGSSGSLFIMQKRNDNLILGISCGVLFAFPIGLVFFNRRRKREDV